MAHASIHHTGMPDPLDNLDKSRTQATPLVVIGGGGHGLVVAEAARACGFAVVGTLDDHPTPVLARGGNDAVHRLGGLWDFSLLDRRGWILGVGTLAVREKLISAIRPHESGGRARSIVHPSAYISPTARLGTGVYVGPHAVVHARAEIGDHAIINSGAIVEHECVIGANTHIAPGTVLGGGVRVGAQTLVGLGSRVLPLLSIGNQCTVGGGAVVVKAVPDGHTVIGVPARERR